MKKLKFDDGLQHYQLGGGVLTFNPRDPALYERFLEGVKAMEALTAQENLTVQEADAALRKELVKIFPGADFEAMLPQNLLAICGNGKLLVLNFLEAVEKLLTEGARAYAAEH